MPPFAVVVRDLENLSAEPIVASSDPVILRGLARLISQRMGATAPVALRQFEKGEEDVEEG